MIDFLILSHIEVAQNQNALALAWNDFRAKQHGVRELTIDWHADDIFNWTV